MKVLYVAKHDSGDNDDEGAILHCLRQQGCEVLTWQEDLFRSCPKRQYDFVLFHKIDDLSTVERYPGFKVFWYFDLITSADWDLKARGTERARWMRRAKQVFNLGFLTDGDWAKANGWEHLLQGADGRVVGPGCADAYTHDIAFIGSQIHGGVRIRSLRELKQRYGKKFSALGHHPKERVHGRALADLLASVKIAIAPEGPVTDLYWSNRVYQHLGFGAFLLHPYCAKLREHYTESELPMYRSQDELYALINHYIERPEERATIAAAGYARTVAEHTYSHRVREMLSTIKERLHG